MQIVAWPKKPFSRLQSNLVNKLWLIMKCCIINLHDKNGLQTFLGTATKNNCRWSGSIQFGIRGAHLLWIDLVEVRCAHFNSFVFALKPFSETLTVLLVAGFLSAGG